MSNQQSGIVKWFNDEKGFGFIENPGGPDIFLHYTQIKTDGYKTVDNRERVYFELRQGPKGPYAQGVVRSHVVARETAKSARGLREIYSALIEQEFEKVDERREVPMSVLRQVALSAHRF